MQPFKLVVVKECDSYYKNLEISYIDDEMSKGFIIPDTAGASCADSGCGGCS